MCLSVCKKKKKATIINQQEGSDTSNLMTGTRRATAEDDSRLNDRFSTRNNQDEENVYEK